MKNSYVIKSEKFKINTLSPNFYYLNEKGKKIFLNKFEKVKRRNNRVLKTA